MCVFLLVCVGLYECVGMDVCVYVCMCVSVDVHACVCPSISPRTVRDGRCWRRRRLSPRRGTILRRYHAWRAQAPSESCRNARPSPGPATHKKVKLGLVNKTHDKF